MATFAMIALRLIEDVLRLLVLLFRSTKSLALVELFDWRHVLVVAQSGTLIHWHRAG